MLTIAASVMYQRLQLLRNASTSELDVNLETLEISEAYLAIVNALACVSEKNAWIFVSKVDEVESPAVKRIKRDDKSRGYLADGVNSSHSNENGIVVGGNQKGV